MDGFRETLRELVAKNILTTRKCIFNALLKLRGEPYEAKKTELAQLIPDLLPQRTMEDAWKLVLENKGLIDTAVNCIGNFSTYHSRNDIYQVVAINLFWASVYWDESRSMLSTYFFSTLKRCKKELKSQIGVVTFPSALTNAINCLESHKNKFPGQSTEDIASQLGTQVERITDLELFSRRRRSSVKPDCIAQLFYSASSPHRMDDGSDAGMATTENVSDEVKKQITNTPERDAIQSNWGESIRRLLGMLNPIEKEIIINRFGFNSIEGHSQKSVGSRVGLSRERARVIELKALLKLRVSPELRTLRETV